MRSDSSIWVPASANKATNGYCAEFGTKRSQVQILSPDHCSALSGQISMVTLELITGPE